MYSLNVARLFDLAYLKTIMHNEEINVKEKYGFDFQRRFKVYSVLHFLRWLSNLMLKREYIIFALKERENIVGGLITSINHNGKTALIGHVSIAKPYRGKHFGSFMINETVEFLKNRNVNKIELSTDIENEVAKKIYLKNGFQVTGMIYQLQGKHFFKHNKDNIFKRVLYKIILNEEKINSEIGINKIWWIKTNKKWYTFIRGKINEKKDIDEMIGKLNVVRKELIFRFV